MCVIRPQRVEPSFCSFDILVKEQVDSPHKEPVTPKVFPFDDVIMTKTNIVLCSIAVIDCRRCWLYFCELLSHIAKYLPDGRAVIGFNSLRPRQNGRLFADDTFKRIFLNENIRISTKNSLKFVPQCLINNIPALVLIMAWRRPGDKPLSEPMLARSLTHICVTRPQWVNHGLLWCVRCFNLINLTKDPTCFKRIWKYIQRAQLFHDLTLNNG